MTYLVYLTSNVETILDRMSRAERVLFDRARQALERNPHPRGGSDLVWRSICVGEFFYSYYDGTLPYIIRYQIDEHPAAGLGVVEIFALHEFRLPGDPVGPTGTF